MKLKEIKRVNNTSYRIVPFRFNPLDLGKLGNNLYALYKDDEKNPFVKVVILYFKWDEYFIEMGRIKKAKEKGEINIDDLYDVLVTYNIPTSEEEFIEWCFNEVFLSKGYMQLIRLKAPKYYKQLLSRKVKDQLDGLFIEFLRDTNKE